MTPVDLSVSTLLLFSMFLNLTEMDVFLCVCGCVCVWFCVCVCVFKHSPVET